MADVTEQEIGSMLAIISRMTDPSHVERIRAAMNNRSESLNRIKVNTLRPGMKVSWNGKRGHQTGIVEKVKNKWVEVKADPGPTDPLGMRWNVTAGILKVIT